MKKFELHKTSSVIRLEITDKELTNDITWKKARKIFFKTRKAGFYYENYSVLKFFTKEELEKGSFNGVRFIVIDKQVFYQPYLTVTFSDGQKRIVYADSLVELENYAKKLKDKCMPDSFSLIDNNLGNFETF